MPQAKLPTLSRQTFDLIFSYAYTGLAVNLCLGAANLPLLAGIALVPDPAAAWPFFVLVSVTIAPSIVGAFAAFDAANAGETTPFRDFWRAWRGGLKRSAVVGCTLVALELAIGFDLMIVAGSPIGALLTPIVIVVLLLALATSTLVLAAISNTDASLARQVRASVFLVIRCWPLSLLTLAALGGTVALVLAQPLLGMLLGVSPLLFIAFSNCRVALARLPS